MDGYLVMAVYSSSDIPVSWHTDRGAAFDAGESFAGVPAELEKMIPVCGEFELVRIVRFRGGQPVEVISLASTDTLCDMIDGPPDGDS